MVQKGAQLAVSGKIETFSGRVQLRNPDRVAPLERLEEVARAGAGVAADGRAVPGADPGGDAAGAGGGAGVAGVARPGADAAGGVAGVPRGAAGGAGADRGRRGTSRGRGSPMTSCWRTRWRWSGRGSGTGGGRAGRSRAMDGCGRRRWRGSGIAPTPAQVQALAEIDADLAAPRRMLRLLQGDVGSGKTLVALLAMLSAAEAGRQAALMAPTEVLAKQHHRTLSALSPVPVVLLTGIGEGRGAAARAARDRARGWLQAGRRHACAVPGGGAVSGSGAGGDRRAAPVRRGPAAACWAARASGPTCW